MVPFKTLLASCDATTAVSDVHDQKVMLDLILIIVDVRNAMVPLITLSASHGTDANTSGITWPEKVMYLILVVLT